MQVEANQCRLKRLQFYEMHFKANQFGFNRIGCIIIEINLY